MEAYPIAFARARAQLDQTIAKLTGDETAEMDHEAVEALIGQDGNELMRQLLQGYFDLRESREARAEVKDSDEVVRRQKRGSSRVLTTLFGSTEVRRLTFRARGASGGRCPLDAELNLPAHRYSAGLQRRVIDEAVVGSYDHVVERISTTTGAAVPKRQAEQIVVEAAQDFDDFYAHRPLGESAEERVLVLSFDGKGVVMRPEALREQTRKRAEKGRKLKRRVSPGEKRCRKRMAQVATVYEVDVVPRTPEEVVGARPGPRPAKARNKRVWASLTTDRVKVTDDAFHEALQRDHDMSRQWAVLVDGDPAQLDYVSRVAASYGIEPFIILDVIHVVERLWTAAWCLFDPGDTKAEKWVSERLLRLLRGQASQLAAALRRSATMRKLSPSKRAGIDKCADYLLKYRNYLRYDQALARGIPIATGVIEGACRHLIKDRMDITGARWGLEGAEAILRLRSLKSSGHLDEYWAYHQRQQLRRNHLRHYADSELTELRTVA